jgi:hypothetical protein
MYFNRYVDNDLLYEIISYIFIALSTIEIMSKKKKKKKLCKKKNKTN